MKEQTRWIIRMVALPIFGSLALTAGVVGGLIWLAMYLAEHLQWVG